MGREYSSPGIPAVQGKGLVFILKRASKEEGGNLEDEKTSSLRRRMRKLR